MALINIQDVTLSFGGPLLLDKINLQIHAGEKICLLGRNGEGKTSAMKLIQGMYSPDSGEIIREKNCTTAYLPQDVPDGIRGSIYDVVTGDFASHDEMQNISADEEQKHRQSVEKVLSQMSLDRGLPFETLSAGMKRRVLLGRAIAAEPDILLLDEPTNHLDLDMIKWIEDFLYRYDKTIFFVTHDRVFLQKIATRIIELDRGKIVDWKCDYNTFLKRKEAVLESEEAQNANFDKKLAQEEAWIRRGIKARRTRNEGRVRALIEMRREREARRERSGNAVMDINSAEKSGKVVIEADRIKFAYGSGNIINDFSTSILRGDKVGIIGPNGCGKSTLIKLLLSELQPDEGYVKTGTRIEKAYFDQLREELDENLSVRDNMSAGGGEIIELNGKRKHVIGYLEDFLFSKDRASVKVKDLSGGEKNRLMLAKLFAKPANFFVLDEPTNDLDLETVELLEDLLVELEGTLLLVSHDRAFLNNVVTSTYAFLGSGEVKEFAGGYDDYLYQLKAGKAPAEKKDKAAKKPDNRKTEKKKLSFKEKNELEAIPGTIEEKENRKKELYDKMSDPSFYKENAPGAADIINEIELLDEELHNLFVRWEELEAIEQK
ncbi:MAG: ATP-binding cassette domain-containing protein [Spirochaetes bacterium]|nr:ATP-binding cassette domain-containing protein [Spirochaetota bacterium]